MEVGFRVYDGAPNSPQKFATSGMKRICDVMVISASASIVLRRLWRYRCLAFVRFHIC